MKPLSTALVGELIGTFLIVFFGCGCVAASVTTGAQSGVFQIAIVWGLGVAIAIHCTAALSGAHLNPAVTVAATVWQGFNKGRVLPYITAQMLGGFIGAAAVYVMFGDALTVFESTNHITRGLAGSEASAAVFFGHITHFRARLARISSTWPRKPLPPFPDGRNRCASARRAQLPYCLWG